MIRRPSDTAINAADYTGGVGYYTDMNRVTDLLGIAPFTTDTIPSLSHVGELIRYAEDYIDEFTRESWRPMLVEKEFHDFDFDWNRMFRNNTNHRYADYVGFIRLHYENVRKIIRLTAWKGNRWDELAGSTSRVTISDYTNVTSLVLTLPNSGVTHTLSVGTGVGQFNNLYGNATTANELVYLINGQLPINTREFTEQHGKKTGGQSKFYHASIEEDGSIIIASLLPDDDGKNCTITANGTGITATDFSDNQNNSRSQGWWNIESDGTVLFRTAYPYQVKHSLKVTYQTGGVRVPAVITESATKLVCCELMSSDDNTILLGENNNSGLDIKTKFDTYRADVDKILKLKKRLIYLVDSD
tara:strand:- start:1979 stop:3052 length:1074 start_codon:yes stop_codon:yes gene_type:complete